MHKQVYDFLHQNGINCSYDEELDCIILNIPVDGEIFQLLMMFPRYYPYRFPKVLLVDCKGYKIPHRFTDKSLCLYDLNERLPNPDNYLEDALMTVNRAKELLLKSINHDNILDFHWEAIEYWKSKAKGKVDFLVEDSDTTRLIWASKLIEDHYIVSDSQESIKEFVGETYRLLTKNIVYEKALFVNVGKKLLLMIDTIKDIQGLIPKEDLPLFFNFLIQNDGKGVIIICADNGKGKCFFSLRIELVSEDIEYVTENIEEILELNREQKFVYMECKNFQMRRLFTRGGDGNVNFDKKCLVIGCGSVGSYLCKAIVDIGIAKSITLLDNDILSVDNIARHLCGSDHLLFDTYKVEALKRELNKHYPTLECQTINENIWEYILYKVEFFDIFDLIFICVGNTVIEKKMIQMLKERKIQKDCIFLWVEPYLVAGHALFIQNSIDEFTEENIFDCNGMFKSNVLENSSQYLKSEAGCQSAYAPYAGFEVQKFVQDVIDLYDRKIYKNRQKYNYKLTWIGKIKWARKQHFDIKPMWRAKEDRYIDLKRIDKLDEISD
ncbi:hypothetical protein D3Z58_22355 [Clostridiaceae bacterium]|nr:hypothetical protein [Clostridiaceae bacterium]